MNGTFSFLYNQEVAHTGFSTNTILFFMNLDCVNAKNRNFCDVFGLLYI